MIEIDESTRDEGRCGYIGDGRDTPCQLVEGWGYDNATAGLCRNHGDRGGKVANQNAKNNPGGGPPESNDNAVTHGAYRDDFLENHMSAEEAERVAAVEELLSTPEGSQRHARMMAGVALEQFRRSGDERFLREYRQLCDAAQIFPSEETAHNHQHAHKHQHGHGHELNERERSALDSVTGGPETIEVETVDPSTKAASTTTKTTVAVHSRSSGET